MSLSVDTGDPDDAGPIRVLHVDDEPQFGEMVSDYLESLDGRITVVTETAARDGLDRLGTDPIDCVVTDYRMPGMDGVEFLRAIREDYPNLPVFLMTGRGSEEVASRAIKAGVTSYVQKGGTEVYEQLANRIRNAMERQRSERRAQVASDTLLALYEQTDGFYILDEDWTVTYWNHEIVERTGLASDEVLGQRFWDVFPAAIDTEVYDRFHRAMEAREPEEFETHYEPGGYWAEVRVHPVNGGLFVHSRDISDEKEREREIERRNQVLESFANTVSHDLRNPLNVAEGQLQLAQETGDFEHLEEVAKAHNRMRNLIDDLLRLARGEELARTEVSLRGKVEDAWDTVSSGPTELVVVADATFRAHDTQLQRLFENLFWNAIDHGGASRIRVGTLGDGGFFVEDDGDGIPAEERGRVFDSGFSTASDSPGYGLSIVEGIVATHDWDVSVVEAVDGGARFEVRDVALSTVGEPTPRAD